MPYVTVWEQRGFKKGKEEGRQEGLVHAGRNVIRALELRFGQIPEPLRERIEQLEELDRLDALHDAALTAESLSAFEQKLGEPGPSGDSQGTPSAN
jgi:hypothetical protein